MRSGIRWLPKMQEEDGHWDARKHGAAGQSDVGVTGLALLSYLGAGHTEKVGQYKDNVRRAVAWLKSRQNVDGLIADANGTDENSSLLPSHAIAGLALAEAAGMANTPDTKIAAQKAVDYSTKHFQHADGGFAYKAGEPGELSATGWFVMQLKSAKVAGLNIGSNSFEKVIRFLDKVEQKGKGKDIGYGQASIYVNRPGDAQGEDVHRLTAIACLCRQLLGWKKQDLEASVRWFVKKGGVPDVWNEEKTDLCYWYFGTLCAFQQGGEVWKEWNEAMKKTICGQMHVGGNEDGSWDPIGPGAKHWGRAGQTALATMCLEVYYRYLRLYKP